ncbi:hypothetical protein VULLAG_LOCUS23325 [Vulpes lagopus]
MGGSLVTAPFPASAQGSHLPAPGNHAFDTQRTFQAPGLTGPRGNTLKRHVPTHLRPDAAVTALGPWTGRGRDARRSRAAALGAGGDNADLGVEPCSCGSTWHLTVSVTKGEVLEMRFFNQTSARPGLRPRPRGPELVRHLGARTAGLLSSCRRRNRSQYRGPTGPPL